MSNDNRSRNPLQPAGNSRRRFLTQAGTAVAGVAASLATHGAEAQRAATHTQTPRYSRPNILFLMSDDMCAELSCYGALARAQTPNLDRLAAEGVRFDRNYCQFPLCNPSRASLFTGRKPTVTGVLGNRTDFRTDHPEWVSLPQFFREHGYATYRTGKIFHGGIDDPKAWDVVGFDENRIAGTELPLEHQRVIPPQPVPPPPPGIPVAKRIPEGTSDPNHGAHSDRILIVEGDGTGHPENGSADRAIAYLREHRDAGSAKQSKPFFLACGFSKPHSPPAAPQGFYDLYDLDALDLPPNFAAWPTVPPGFPSAAIRKQNADLFIGRGASELEAKEVLRAYLASTSWVDWNIGRVLKELDATGLRQNTIVIFVADHGYQLGERGKWSKAGSLFEMGTRIPLIIRAPDATGNGRSCYRTVQSIDLYPTLLELCGFSPSAEQEGASLVPLLQNPQATWEQPAFSIWSEDGKTVHGTSIRTERYRYVEFGDKASHGAMLFDEHVDPYELTNLADDPAHAKLRADLSIRIARYHSNDIGISISKAHGRTDLV
jgi:iduronate 2-sulfatase